MAQFNTVYDSLCGFWIDWSSHGCGVCVWNGIIMCVYYVYLHVNANAGLCVCIWSGVYAYGGCVCA